MRDFTAAKDGFLAACKGKKVGGLWNPQCAEQLGLNLRTLRALQAVGEALAIVEGAGDAAALEAAMANWLCVVKSNDFTAAKDVFLAACKGKKASNVWGAQCAEQLGLILRALR
jgi:hypothetical protein